MKKLLIVCILVFSFPGPVFSNESGSALLGNCLIDSLTGKERKKLAQWVFFAMAVHPEFNEFAKISDEDRVESEKFIGHLFTRLLADDCPAEARVAIAESSLAFQNAFQLVGQVAMQELMANEKVAQSFAGPDKYIDAERLSELASEIP